MATQTYLPPKFSFSTDFGHFILKMLENAKFAYVSRKNILKYQFLGGTSPADFSTAGDASPPPFLTPMMSLTTGQYTLLQRVSAFTRCC